jgi:hypothetical protein
MSTDSSKPDIQNNQQNSEQPSPKLRNTLAPNQPQLKERGKRQLKEPEKNQLKEPEKNQLKELGQNQLKELRQNQHLLKELKKRQHLLKELTRKYFEGLTTPEELRAILKAAAICTPLPSQPSSSQTAAQTHDASSSIKMPHDASSQPEGSNLDPALLSDLRMIAKLEEFAQQSLKAAEASAPDILETRMNLHIARLAAADRRRRIRRILTASSAAAAVALVITLGLRWQATSAPTAMESPAEVSSEMAVSTPSTPSTASTAATLSTPSTPTTPSTLSKAPTASTVLAEAVTDRPVTKPSQTSMGLSPHTALSPKASGYTHPSLSASTSRALSTSRPLSASASPAPSASNSPKAAKAPIPSQAIAKINLPDITNPVLEITPIIASATLDPSLVMAQPLSTLSQAIDNVYESFNTLSKALSGANDALDALSSGLSGIADPNLRTI